MRFPVPAIVLSLLLAGTSFAADPPHLWVKAKCALCHGRNGDGKTGTGRKLAVRDLRSKAVQKLTDQELRKAVLAGHNRMPDFRNQLSAADVQVLVRFIRSLAIAEKKP